MSQLLKYVRVNFYSFVVHRLQYNTIRQRRGTPKTTNISEIILLDNLLNLKHFDFIFFPAHRSIYRLDSLKKIGIFKILRYSVTLKLGQKKFHLHVLPSFNLKS